MTQSAFFLLPFPYKPQPDGKNIAVEQEVSELANQGLAIHETMEIHEILSFKNVCMTKSFTMQGLVSDPDLKALMQTDVEQSERAIAQLQNLLSKAQNNELR